MPLSPHQNITQMLRYWGDGDREALDKLIPIVYEELRHQAARYLRRERPGGSRLIRRQWAKRSMSQPY